MRTASKIAATALIALAALAAAPVLAPTLGQAIATAPHAAAQPIVSAMHGASAPEITRMTVRQAAVAQGPGGCQTFNEAVQAAVATQLRRGDLAEARRLAAMEVPCRAR